MKIPSGLRVLSILLLGLCPGFAQTLYTEDFDSDHSTSWSFFRGGGTDSSVDFYFDYGTQLGIPAAPHSTNGVTRGMRFLANQSAGVFQGISASPIAQGFTGNYRLRFDMWLNHVGPLTLGGNGSTQCGSWGVGGTGQSVQWASVSPNGVMFAATSDGGSTDDYRCYSNSVHLAETSGAYAASSSTGARNSTNSYYSTFGNEPAPAAQLTLYSEQTGNTAVGALGFKWRDVIVERIGNTVTCYIDGKRIATSQTPGSFSTNIFFGHFDINAGSSTSVNDLLTCSIFDNITVEVIQVTSVSVAATATATEGLADGAFTITRSGGDTNSSLTVPYTMSGTASNGVDYTTLPGSVTFNAGELTKVVTVQPIDDLTAEFAESVILTLQSSSNYVIGAPSAATVNIADNETPELSITTLQSTAYERTPNDYFTFQITRKGSLSNDVTANLVYTGTATNGVNYFASSSAQPIVAGSNSMTFKTFIIDDSFLEDTNLTVVATITSDASYTIGTSNSATGTIIDDELAPETVLFADDLTSDTSTNWTTLFGANNGLDDKQVLFAFDLTTDPLNSGIPTPPIGVNTVLKLSVNKDEPTAGGAAGVNLYPIGKNFSGDFALRFDMYLQQNVPTSTTEFATFGINHSGTKTNWNRQSATNVANVNSLPKDSDGLWFSVISDASASAPGDYALFTGTNAASAPTLIKTATAAGFSAVFKNPPFSPGTSASGVPANIYGSADKVWVNVEVKKVGSIVTMSINKTPILTYTNTTSYTSGNIMLGYMDPYDSIGATGGSVYYSNLRVVNLSTTPQTPVVSGVQLINSGSQVQITFTGAASDSPSSFSVESSSTFSASAASYTTEGGAVITATPPGSGSFTAVVPVSTSARFYLIKR